MFPHWWRVCDRRFDLYSPKRLRIIRVGFAQKTGYPLSKLDALCFGLVSRPFSTTLRVDPSLAPFNAECAGRTFWPESGFRIYE